MLNPRGRGNAGFVPAKDVCTVTHLRRAAIARILSTLSYNVTR